MKKLLKFFKILGITIITLLVVAILFLRFSRFSDRMIYQVNGSEYAEFSSQSSFEEFFFEVDDDVKLHGVLFKPSSEEAIGTIFHYSGKGMHLMSSIQKSYEPLLKKGFQVFCFERRGFGQSTGEAKNSVTLKEDALNVFDQVARLDEVAQKPLIVWGQSLGGAFATMTAKERQNKIDGLVLEGTFGSFPDIGKVYARALNLERFKWVIPLIMNNDFPAKEAIQALTIPVIISHSKNDDQVPYELGREIFEASNKSTTDFWDVDSKHIMAIYDYEEKYVNDFLNMLH
ncbi:alpha/beta hydrolase [Roseivirga misakiensis]|uniref:Serine aminopeptidase S33 domain-containing protein n=1 Tax=Roseivirga misakiensis TaxID=1563681 RepID=A0A1E5T0R0_9BACT|nr:alpha/beta fold hydrolase [Roseivirga misakiensis]OEK04935.1 hypothetical protein BFP71_15990 [Roseivirga misakiensis]